MVSIFTNLENLINYRTFSYLFKDCFSLDLFSESAYKYSFPHWRRTQARIFQVAFSLVGGKQNCGEKIPVLDNSRVVSKDKPWQIIAWNNSKETGRDNDMSQSRRDQDRGWATHYKQRHKTSSEYRVKNRIVTQDLNSRKQIIRGPDVVMKGHFLPSHQIFYCIFRLIVLDVQNSRGKPGKITGHIFKYESDFCILNTLNQKIKSCKSESLSLLMPLQPVLKLMQKKKKIGSRKTGTSFFFLSPFLMSFQSKC